MDGYAAAEPAQANGLKFEHLIPPETVDLAFFFRMWFDGSGGASSKADKNLCRRKHRK
jgi:hypothetical protein